MPPIKRGLLIGIIVILTTLGIPLLKSENHPVQAETKAIEEFNEIQVAQRLANSNVRMDCKSFAVLWQTLFPDAKCYKYKTNLGTTHWVCEINSSTIVEANYNFDRKIQIRQK